MTARSGNRAFLRRFGHRLKLLRVDRRLSQEQLGESAGMHRTFVGKVERGETGLNVDRLPDLARALGVDEHELIPRPGPDVTDAGSGQRSPGRPAGHRPPGQDVAVPESHGNHDDGGGGEPMTDGEFAASHRAVTEGRRET